MARFLFSAFFLAFTVHTANAQLIINELMQSNIDCIMDDLNEFPDSWVELYNNGSEAVNLQDYRIGAKEDFGNAWQLPAQRVNPGQYVLVYCDKEETGLHTDFRLDSGKGNVYLFHGDEVESVAYKKMPAPNIAYGRKTDGADEWGYQQKATPRAANCGTTCVDILGDVTFSEKGRVLTSSSGSISLTLSLPEGNPEEAVIRYTMDGSEPTELSTPYQSAINIDQNRVIRAKAFCDGWLSPMSTAQSYIFLGRDMKIPVISIVTKDSYMNDATIGILHKNNNSGKDNKVDWRRPINIEMFEEAGAESVINQLGETRVAGGQSRSNDLKTLAVYANKRFGTKRFDYEFFPDQKPGLRDFKSIMLRNSGNDFGGLYMRDAVIQRVMGQNADIDWQAWKPAIIYINGVYMGMLNIRERSNDDNIYSNYDGLEDIDMVEIVHEKDGNNDLMIEELKVGTWDRYNAFKNFYSTSGHTMAEYNEIMDVNEYINIMVMNLYFGNIDFPGNNIIVWTPTENGGRWRWVAKDTDFGLGLYGWTETSSSFNTLDMIFNPNNHNNSWAFTEPATRLFRNLLADPDFKREFIDHCAIYMGDFLNARGTHKIWDPMNNLVHSELILHREINPNKDWMGRPLNDQVGAINNEVNSVNNWVNSRTDNFYNFLQSNFQLGAPTPLVINKDVTEQVTTIVNGIEIKYTDDSHPSPYFDGKFFVGRQLKVEGKAGEGRRIKGWKVTQTNSNGSVSEQNVLSPVYEFPMPSCRKLVLTAICDDVLPGDVDGDGEVDVADVVCLVNYIIGKPVPVFIEEAAEVDLDGEIDVADAVTIVNWIISREPSSAKSTPTISIDPQ